MSITVPNVLGADVRAIEAFYNRTQELPPAQVYEIDMSQVSFIRPYGLLALVIAGRNLSQVSGNKVLLSRMRLNTYQYLERMALFEIGNDWFDVDSPLQERWNRDSRTANLLELTLVSTLEDVDAIVCRADNIFSRWLSISDISNLINVLSELSTNVFDHSADRSGCVLIQKVEIQGQAVVRLAVGDLGCGIPGSLAIPCRSSDINNTLGYLIEALNGKTTRSTGRGGLGLRQVERIAGNTGGYLWLRSHDAAIASYGSGRIQGYPNLAFIPGTQIAVELLSS